MMDYNPFVHIYFLNEYMIGLIFFKHRYMMSRTARLTVLWFSLLGEVLAVGGLMYLTDLDRTIEAAAIPVMAVFTMIWVGPLFNAYSRLPTKHARGLCRECSHHKGPSLVRHLRAVAADLHAGTIPVLMTMTEEDVHWW